MNIIKEKKQSITIHILKCDKMSLEELYDIFKSDSRTSDDLSFNRDEKFFTGTIKKEYFYLGKRTIDQKDVSGKEENKFFKFFVKELLDGFAIVMHYEGLFGAYASLKQILKSNFDLFGLKNSEFDFETKYKMFEYLKYTDLEKIVYESEIYEKSIGLYGNFDKKTVTFLEIPDCDVLPEATERVTSKKILDYLSISDTDISEGDNLFIYLKDSKKRINILTPNNTRFNINVGYDANKLPKQKEFEIAVNKVLKEVL